jgi:hypothetical protein
MSTQAQIDANRLNAQSSTGPRTDEGKQVASRNAVQHGLRSADPVGPGESREEYVAFALELLEELNPVGVRQRMVAERYAQLQWKLRRIPQIEVTTLAMGKRRMQDAAARQGLRPPLGITTAELIARDLDTTIKLQTYETRLQRAAEQAMRELRQLQAEAAAKAEAEKAKPAPGAEPTSSVPAEPTNHTATTLAPAPNSPAGQDLPPNWVRSAEPPAPVLGHREGAPQPPAQPPADV